MVKVSQLLPLLSAAVVPCLLQAEITPEFLGNPLSERYPAGEMVYARNVWDMQLYRGRIYIGGGNSSNRGPAINAGRVPVFAYDIESNNFYSEGVVAEEQIDIYRVLDSLLYIPGHDATQNWDWGNYYVRAESSDWTKHRTIPGALHVYDISLFQNSKLYAALGRRDGAAIAMSSDGGLNWSVQPLGRGRVYGFLSIDDQLFAAKQFKDEKQPLPALFKLEADNTFKPNLTYTISRVFPNTDLSGIPVRMIRAISFGRKALYIGAYVHNDHQAKPFGLYLATVNEKKLDFEKLNLPEGLVPRDLLLRDGTVYLLASEPQQRGVRVSVYRSQINTLLVWEEILTFNYPTFARSFEEHAGNFYFGMGSEIRNSERWHLSELLPETGNVLRITASAWRPGN